MCGFSGVISNSSIETSRLEKSLSKISHRGPDASAHYYSPDGRCGLAHVRLAILDPSSQSNQPMKNGPNIIAYNGEVYNHWNVRNQILGNFQTNSDTETILNGYIIKGKEIFNILSGMFAGAIYNEASKELILFRDSLGIKNLYYYESEDALYFSSEIKGLLELLPNYLEVDTAVINTYLKFENYPQGTSFLKGVKNLLPGEIKTVKIGDKLDFSNSCIAHENKIKLPSSDLVSQGKSIIEEAVFSHLLSDVPLGVYLSGGIDSSLVATIAAKKIKDLEGFTGYFETEDQYYDERYYSRLVAKSAGIHLNEIKITPQDFLENFDDVIWHLDEPRMGMGAFSQYIVAREAAKKRKVILAGHGGDELFAGYPMFKAFWLYSKMGLSISNLKLMSGMRQKEWIWIFYLIFKHLREGKLYFAPEIFEEVSSKFDANFFTNDNTTPLNQLMDYYRNVYIPGLLVVEDKISMAHSLETRTPLWSNELFQWANTLSPEVKLKNGELKHLLREIARDYLPAELLSAEKRGFPTPLRIWFRKELKEFIQERLLKKNDFLDNYVSLETRKKIINGHISKELPFALDEKRAHKIWMLLCLESWNRQYRK